jgi:hypothetical protein
MNTKPLCSNGRLTSTPLLRLSGVMSQYIEKAYKEKGSNEHMSWCHELIKMRGESQATARASHLAWGGIFYRNRQTFDASHDTEMNNIHLHNFISIYISTDILITIVNTSFQFDG